jgi:hypothetical protein
MRLSNEEQDNGVETAIPINQRFRGPRGRLAIASPQMNSALRRGATFLGCESLRQPLADQPFCPLYEG